MRLTNPVDLQRPGIHGGVIYGMPISGRAIHHHLIAAEVGWRGFSVFAGTIFNRDDTGASTAWTHDGTWGLMFSSQAIVNLFAKSKK